MPISATCWPGARPAGTGKLNISCCDNIRGNRRMLQRNLIAWMYTHGDTAPHPPTTPNGGTMSFTANPERIRRFHAAGGKPLR